MERLLARIDSNNDRGFCKIVYDGKDEVFLIEFHDDHGKLFFTKVFTNAVYKDVEEYANVWANSSEETAEALI